MESLTAPTTLLFLFAILGTFSHWVKKRVRDKIRGGPVDYLISHPRHTFGMIVTTVTACCTVAMVPGFSLESMSPLSAAMLGWTTGWAADSAINKGPGQ